MNAHVEAWNHVKEHLFGKVCEVARKTPWGFKEDREDIVNVSVEQFLKSSERYDSIILHILSGEGEPMSNILKVLESAYDRCLKIVVLEHNPKSEDFSGLQSLLPIHNFICVKDEIMISENWGRNLLMAFTTMNPLHLPQLCDKYYKDNINEVFVEAHDEGIDSNHLIYTHCSEKSINFNIPKGIVGWVIGGGLAYESMNVENENTLFDSVLRQVIYCAKQYNPSCWKLDRLYNFNGLKVGDDYKQWRVIKPNGVKPDSIQHKSLQDIECSYRTVYVSTIHRKYWEHLVPDNDIIDSWTERDTPRLILNDSSNSDNE